MDLASLNIAIDSREVSKGATELDKLTSAGERADKAIEELGRDAQTASGQIRSASQQAADMAEKAQLAARNANQTGSSINYLGKASSAARADTQALGRELGNLAGNLATGNVSAENMTGSITRMAGSMRVGGPVILAVAAAAGLLAAAFLGVKQQAADDAAIKAYIATLGLTEKETKRLTDTTVTWGDVAQATFEVLAEKAGTSSAEIKSVFKYAFGQVGEFGKFSISVIYAAFVAGVKGIGRIASGLPGMIGEAAVGAANVAIAAVEKLINFQIKALNKIAAGINTLFGTNIGQIAEVSLGRLQNSFAGTSKAVAAGIKGDFFGAYWDAMGTFDAISARATKIREDEIKSQADDIIADRTNKAAKAHRDRAAAAKEEADALDRLAAQRDKLSRVSPPSNDLIKASETDVGGKADLSNIPMFASDYFTKGLQDVLDQLQLIAEQASVTGQSLSSAFGEAGGVIGSMVTNLVDYQQAQASLAIDVLEGNKTQAQADKTLATLRTRNTASALAGFKSLFKEHSTGYKVMSAIEKAYAAFQAAQTIASIARDATKTASSLANSATRTAANTAEGGSKIFAELGPWAFPVVAAMVAVLAALGAKGGGGGGVSRAPTSAQDLQDAAGAGSVLGDTKAKSASIANSLEIVAANTNKDLEYSNAMLRSLQSIDFSISKLAGTVARQIQVSGSMFDTSGLKLGTSGSGGFLGIGAKTTTRTLYDLGLVLNSGSLSDIIANGISGQTYQIVEKVKKKSGFLGIGGGTKTSYKTTYGTIDPEITSAIQDVLTSLRDGLLSAADVIGLEGAQAILDSFNVSLGTISFKDMTGEQIEDQLNAIFSKVGDDMAAAIFPSLKDMQKIGEGLFETFIRVAREYEVVDVALRSIGREFGAVGVQSVAMRDALVQLFGGLEDFVDATSFFRDQFLSEGEQVAPIQAAVIAELQRLGMAGITTRDQFKQAVLGLDLTTTAGREMYAALLKVAPAFDKTLDYFEKLNKATADGLKSTVDQFTKFADSLKKYRDTLFATDASQGNAYRILRKRFLDTALLAGGGDATALGGLESAGKSFLDVAKNNASTREQYLRDVALVAQGVDKGIFAAEATADYAQLQLDALTNAVSILGDIAVNTAIVAGTAPAPSVPGSAPAGDSAPAPVTDPVVAGQNATIIDQNRQIIDLLTQQQRTWSRFDGDGLLIRTDADTPINVVSS